MSRMLLLCMVLSFCSLTVCSATEEFKGHKLIRIQPCSQDQLNLVYNLKHISPYKVKLDFWNEPVHLCESVDIKIEPEVFANVHDILQQGDIPYRVLIEDVQRVINEQKRQYQKSRSEHQQTIYTDYLRYNEMVDWLQRMEKTCGRRCVLFSIGSSYEGRNIFVFKISTGKTTGKKKIWIDGGIHAREWITTAVSLYIIDRLVMDSDIDAEVETLLNEYDWYIAPLLNPDGYEYSHDKNRLWRKTRSRVSGSDCIGVDANRNFGFHWGMVGTSDEPCSETYKGPRPFSEPEVRAVDNFILAHKGSWHIFVTLHSYGQLWMMSYGYSSRIPEHYDQLMRAAATAAEALKAVRGTVYNVGRAIELMYQSSGTSRDWASGVAEIPFVYTIELPDNGQRGFLLPPAQILPTSAETWEGVKTLAKTVSTI